MAEPGAAAEVERADTGEIVSWRLRCLLEAGYDEEIAARVAAELEVDLHAALRLVERGCPPALASRILL